jgi:hypothetical protein
MSNAAFRFEISVSHCIRDSPLLLTLINWNRQQMSKQGNTSEAENGCSGYEIPHVTWNYCVHNRSPRHILNQTNLLGTLAYYFFKIYFNVISPSLSRNLNSLLPHAFSTTILYEFLFFLARFVIWCPDRVSVEVLRWADYSFKESCRL